MNSIDSRALKPPSLSRLQQRFNQAAPSYPWHALIQKEILEYLFLLAKKTLIPSPMLILDIGCGAISPDYFLKSSHPHFMRIGLDLAYQMLTFNSKDRLSINGDFHDLPFQSQVFDALWSSSALHWAQDLQQVFFECARILKPGGYFYISTFVQGTLHEIQKTWQTIDGSSHTLPFQMPQDYIQQAKSSGLSLLHQETRTFSTDFHSPKEALLSLKNIGSTVTPAHPYLIGPKRFKQFETVYWTKYGTPSHTVPVTYNTLFLLLQKDAAL